MESFIASFKKNKIGIFLIIISSILVCFGQLLWKLSSTEGIYYLLIGFFLYGLGAIIMIVAYKFGSLSVLQPFLSLNYVLSVILGYFILNELISTNKIIGIFLIILGVIFIGGGDE